MYRHNILLLIAVVSVVIVLALPLYLKLVAYPAYEELLINNVEQEMQLLACQMVKGHQFSAPFSPGVPLSGNFIEDVEFVQRTVGLPKIKIFSKEGIIVYSTDPADLGTKTTQNFFPQMLVDGLPRTKLKIVEMAGPAEDTWLIETYVPIIDRGIAVGAFEIYRDITGLRQTFQRKIHDERKILLPVIVLLLAGGLTSSWLAHKSMTDLKRAKDEFQQLSVTDTLTGLLNRRGFTTMVEKQLSSLQRSGKGAFLFFIDMNDFKRINDKYGHDIGDQALVEAAEILKSTLRAADIIGRIGGDEFAALTVINDNLTSEAQIKQRLVEKLVNWNQAKSVDYTLSFSIGIVEIAPDNVCSVYELMRCADEKMYREKHHNKALKGDE